MFIIRKSDSGESSFIVIVDPFIQQRTNHMKGGLADHSNENGFWSDYATKNIAVSELNYQNFGKQSK